MKKILLAALMATLSACGTVQQPVNTNSASTSPMKFPCLSYSLSCGEIPVRKPVNKQLSGELSGNSEEGRNIAFTKTRGNCLACHRMKGGTQPGSRGPDLTSYGNLGRSDAETYALVYDMRWRSPDTLMPPMGTNEILTEQEIRDVVAFLQSSK